MQQPKPGTVGTREQWASLHMGKDWNEEPDGNEEPGKVLRLTCSKGNVHPSHVSSAAESRHCSKQLGWAQRYRRRWFQCWSSFPRVWKLLKHIQEQHLGYQLKLSLSFLSLGCSPCPWSSKPNASSSPWSQSWMTSVLPTHPGLGQPHGYCIPSDHPCFLPLSVFPIAWSCLGICAGRS